MPSSNPLWFGYYPGDRPMNRRPPQVTPPTPINAPDLGINEAIDEALKAVDAPGNFIEDLPKQVWEWIKEDWKQSLNVGASPATGMGGKELYQFGSEEVADVKGVYAQINLFDLATNPKKTIGKFIEKSLDPLNPFKATTTLEGEFFSDLATNAEVSMWRSLLNQNGSAQLPWSGYFRDTFSPTSSPIDLNEHRIFARKTDDDAKTFKTYVTQQGETKYESVAVEKEVDVYQQVAESHLNFVLGKKSPFTRNGSYRNFNNSVIEATATELSQNRTKLDQIFANDRNSADIETRVNTFLGEYGVVTRVADVDDGLGKLSKTMAKKGFTDQVTIGDIKSNLATIDKSAEEALKQIEDIRSKIAGNPLAKRDFDKGVREIEGHLRRTREFTALYIGRTPTDVLGRFTQAEVLNSQVAQLKSRFSSNRYGGGVQDRYLENIGRRYFEGQHSLLGLDYIDPTNPSNPLLSKGYGSLGQLYDYNKRIFWQEAGRDISTTIGKGKLADQFLWFGSLGDLYIGDKRVPLSEIGLIKDRIQMLTPGYWTKQVMDRTHSFGLVYNEKMEDRVLHPVFNKLPWIIKNEFTEDFDYKVGGVVVGHINAKFSGSKDLQNFHSVWSAAKNGQLISSGTGQATAWVRDATLNDEAKLLLLNGDPLALGGGNRFVGITSNPEEFLNSMASVRADLVKKLGLTVQNGKIENTPQNLAKLDAFYGQLQKRIDNRALLSPFREKFGILEIYAHKLSVIQQKIYTKLGLNKVAQSFAQFKTALAQRITDVVSKFGAKVLSKLGIAALGTATAGLGLLLAPVIEKLLQATVAKIVDKAKDLLRAVIKGNFQEAFSGMMDDAMNATQKVFTCGCIVPIITSFAVLLLMGTVITSISPVDRSKATSSSSASSGGDPFTVPGDTVPGSNCPLKSASKTLGSYTNVAGTGYDATSGHGSRYYWEKIYTGGASKMFSIPFLNSSTWSCPGGNCSPLETTMADESPLQMPGALDKKNKSVSYYGYAADFASSDRSVYAPAKISCGADVKITSWHVDVTGYTSRGCYLIMTGTSEQPTDPKYKLMLLHVNYCGDGGCSSCYSGKNYVGGQGITTLYPTNPHIHVELTENYVSKRPEDCVCK